MKKIVLIARQNEAMTELCSEINELGLPCSITGRDTVEQISRFNTGLVLLEYDESAETEVISRYVNQEIKIPIIALVSVDDIFTLDKLVADFVVKPYNARELAMRIRRLVQKETDTSPAQIKSGSIVIDSEKYEVYVEGRLIPLTFKEYELLKFLASNPGRVYTRDILLNNVWSDDYFGGDRTVDVHIRRLRSKIETPDNVYIETVRNIGYRFVKR